MFVQRLDASESAALYETAAQAAEILNAVGEPWWLSHGSLLGAWRHQGIIPWDDDLDLAFPRAKVFELEAAAKACGWRFRLLKPFLAKIWDPEAAIHRTRHPWTWPFCDIALYDEENQEIVVESGHHTRIHRFHCKDILPTQPHTFGPLTLPVPARPELMLNAIYPEWATRPTSSRYCHRQERPYALRPERASIVELAERFPMVNVPEAKPPLAWDRLPRLRCINLERATERREQFTRDWIDGLGYPIKFFVAFDRRQVEQGKFHFPYDEVAARQRTRRPLTSGEIACATSHALVMREELESCGPEGVIIFEDDCSPMPGADRLVERIQTAVAALPGVEVVACHEPHVRFTIREEAGGAVRIKQPPWGSIVTWYSPQGLRRAFDLTSKLNCPADWIWQDFAREGKFAMLKPAVASHARSDTTYIGNQFRGVRRKFIA